jgi:hypothetical protein
VVCLPPYRMGVPRSSFPLHPQTALFRLDLYTGRTGHHTHAARVHSA